MLRLLGTDLDGPDIARELFVSLNTVRTHTKNIYAKLGVNNRRAAVRRAEGARRSWRDPGSGDCHLRITTPGDPHSSHPLLPFARRSGRR